MEPGEQSRPHGWAVVITAIAVSAAVFLLPGLASAIPAVDEYVPAEPNASGENAAGEQSGGGASQAQSDGTQANTQAEDSAPEGASPPGGAAKPVVVESGAATQTGSDTGSEDRSLPEATGSALTEPLGIVVMLAVIAILAFALFRRRRSAGE